jgi:ABC-type transport system substrate-binding protein
MAEYNQKLVSSLNRRRILKGMGVAGVASLAGCFGGDDEEDSEEDSLDPVQDRVEVDPDDIVEGGTFRVAAGANPDSFDYPYSSSAEATMLMNLMYEGMITTDSTGEIYPWLAESFEQVDVQDVDETAYADYMTSVPYAEDDEGNTYIDTDEQIVIEHPDNDPESDDEAQVLTPSEASEAANDGTYGVHHQFSLHDGVEFHDGEEMTAENVVASYRRVENSALSGQVYDSLLHIEASGDYTIELYGQIPDAAFVREIAGLPVYPTASTDLPPEQMDPRQGNTPLGTGPFQFEDYEDESYFRFSTNDDYWFDTEMKDWYDGDSAFPNGPAVDEVDVQIVPDPASRSAALQNDEIDLAWGLTSSTLNDFQSSEDFRTSATQGAGFTFMQFPVTQEPWDDPRLRRAVNHLIPRENIVDQIYSGWESPAWVPLPPLAATDGTTDYDQLEEDLKSYNAYDPERAGELVQEVADEKDLETPIEITIETNSDNDDRVRTVELIAEAMSRTDHFDANVETYEFLTFVGQLLSGSYHEDPRLAVIGLSGGFGPHGYAKSIHHPDNFAQCCNFQNIDNSDLNQALQEARYGVDVVQDDGLRRERYNKVWELILEINANSYTTHSLNVGVVQSHVKGYNTYPSTQDIVGYGLYSPMEEQITYLDNQ